MKAIVYERYGSPDVLELRDIEAPSVTGRRGQVLVRRGQVLRSRIPRPPDSLSVHAHRRPGPSTPA